MDDILEVNSLLHQRLFAESIMGLLFKTKVYDTNNIGCFYYGKCLVDVELYKSDEDSIEISGPMKKNAFNMRKYKENLFYPEAFYSVIFIPDDSEYEITIITLMHELGHLIEEISNETTAYSLFMEEFRAWIFVISMLLVFTNIDSELIFNCAKQSIDSYSMTLLTPGMKLEYYTLV